jgi:hypothetical protein
MVKFNRFVHEVMIKSGYPAQFPKNLLIRSVAMNTYMKYFFTVAMMLAIGIAAAGTATAGEEPIYHNFVNETTLSGTLPDAAGLTNTAPIGQAQVGNYHEAGMPARADRQASPEAVPETRPIWAEHL